MNKKGQNQIGMLITLAIAVIVGAILLTATAQNISGVTDTVAVANQSFTSASEGNSAYLTNWRAIDSVVMYNATAEIVPASNYTVTNNVIDPTTGGLSTQVTTAASALGFANETWRISGTAQPTTYDNSAGGRSIAGIIVLLMALALVAVTVGVAVKMRN